MSAFDGLDDLDAWLHARAELVDAWLSCGDLTARDAEPQDAVTAGARQPEPAAPAFGGSLFGVDGGQSSGGGSSGGLRLAA